MKLRVEAYVATTLPALHYITSVRAVVVTADGCAVLHNVDGVHVLPGGRRRAAESIDETLSRELLEETGCRIATSRLLGFLHFRHLTARPADYEYPYPDFAHAVFAVRGVSDPGFAGDPDRYEAAIEFVPPADLDRFELPAYQRLLVAAALRVLA